MLTTDQRWAVRQSFVTAIGALDAKDQNRYINLDKSGLLEAINEVDRDAPGPCCKLLTEGQLTALIALMREAKANVIG